MVFVRIALLAFLTFYSFSMGQIPPAGLNGFGKLVAGLFFVFAPALYLLPTYEAWKRQQPNMTPTVLVNIFLGWTLIGWVAAMVMAYKSTEPQKVELVYNEPAPTYTPAPAQPASKPSIADELSKLADLKQQGLLTEEEFNQQKARLLA
ncbi:superinfection immunity protein [Comamonas terrae]|uniref:Superinfection immunity protein n=1 Tax=Comamonas terrae TaxID=673548 RepID=A0ABW5UR41_9BURK|nr:superinfection immunity protein [Comamonas terrae]